MLYKRSVELLLTCLSECFQKENFCVNYIIEIFNINVMGGAVFWSAVVVSLTPQRCIASSGMKGTPFNGEIKSIISIKRHSSQVFGARTSFHIHPFPEIFNVIFRHSEMIGSMLVMVVLA